MWAVSVPMGIMWVVSLTINIMLAVSFSSLLSEQSGAYRSRRMAHDCAKRIINFARTHRARSVLCVCAKPPRLVARARALVKGDDDW